MIESSIAFVFGVLFGSFLNVVILRIPKEESVVFTPSHCPTCNTKLKPWHNIPLLSWLFLRGKCAFCTTSISIQYPIVELISGLIFWVVVSRHGLGLESFFLAWSFLMLLALSIIDFRYKMVPDSLNLLAIVFAIFNASSPYDLVQNLQNALLFAGGFSLLRFALSYYLSESVYRAGLKTKTAWNRHYDRTPMIEALGEGDIMVGATMGAVLGVQLGLFAVFLSALLALPVMLLLLKRPPEEQKLPYVPFLALATFISFIYEKEIVNYLATNFGVF